MPTYAEMRDRAKSARQSNNTSRLEREAAPATTNHTANGNELEREESERSEQLESGDEDDDLPKSVYIDVALGNKKHRITLFRDSNAEQMAADFAAEHKLDKKLTAKLCE